MQKYAKISGKQSDPLCDSQMNDRHPGKIQMFYQWQFIPEASGFCRKTKSQSFPACKQFHSSFPVNRKYS